MQVRVARPTLDLAAARRFYGELLGLPVVASFENHDGYDGVVFGLPDASRQLELVWHAHAAPAPTEEDQLVFYLGSDEQVVSMAARLRAAGLESRDAVNPYWGRTVASASSTQTATGSCSHRRPGRRIASLS
jgi:catechol 2,3-dioxygenase-like lactoylglutathione lyase family enzyme